ncbi:lipid-transfer protein [Striga asiatica]|uniref:Lipid-transfer protein n=1 Tax=Striga asiatica TaxID=4170 RepID=A0A5A7PET8_STRAF|nr:lipid-transfer protein [Striga asiatica]
MALVRAIFSWSLWATTLRMMATAPSTRPSRLHSPNGRPVLCITWRCGKSRRPNNLWMKNGLQKENKNAAMGPWDVLGPSFVGLYGPPILWMANGPSRRPSRLHSLNGRPVFCVTCRCGKRLSGSRVVPLYNDKANVLGIVKVKVPIALSLVVNSCGKKVPQGIDQSGSKGNKNAAMERVRAIFCWSLWATTLVAMAPR